jgi:sulfite reductase (ferredoxin)
VVRNITAAEVSGIWPDEAFDVTPHGMALAKFLLRHPDGQSLGRKMKIHLSSTFDPDWNLSSIHDIGATAVILNGQRGFEIRVGGGLGAVPHEAQVLYEFLPEDELLPLSHAILRVFARLGEKKKRARARLKFLVAGLGLDGFRQEVEAERSALPFNSEWSAFLTQEHHPWTDTPLRPRGSVFPSSEDPEVGQWLRTNVYRQSQEGYAAVKVRVPTGDLTPTQLRGLAALLRAHVGDTARVGVDQSLLLRWVAFDRLLIVRDALAALDLARSNAGGLGDTVACPGADTCKLGITSPRAAARHVQPLLDRLAKNPRLQGIRVKISGCPNSCAQHQVADIGFFGAARTVNGVTAPHFMLILGGMRGGLGAGDKLGDGFGTPLIKVPALRVGDAIETLLGTYLERSEPGEAFGTFARRLGRRELKGLLQSLTDLPAPDVAPEFYREPGSTETFTVRRGVGECAGEVIDLADLLLADADREAEQALDLFESEGDTGAIVARSQKAMTLAARALLSLDGLTNPDAFDPVDAFRERFYDRGRFYEGVGHYFLAGSELDASLDPDRLRRLVAEAGLFVEEAHTVVAKTANPYAGVAK